LADRYVVALGGNALIPPGGKGTAEEQIRAVRAAMTQLAPIAASGAQVVITHGNGPQVGNLLLKNEIASDVVPPMPLDWCVAQTQATIGLVVQEALEFELRRRSSQRTVAVVLTRVVVDPLDPRRLEYTKPIGRRLSEAEAHAEEARRGHRYAVQPDGTWRRVVPSPEPTAIVEEAEIRQLVEGGAVVVAAGGGGVPVEEGDGGRLLGVEAVIDKDLTAALLGRRLQADALVILTEARGAAINFGREGERYLERVSPEIVRGFQRAGHFAAGSMGPKVEAALRFTESGRAGARAAIGALAEAASVIAGETGTQIIGR
jgi:carbamate kinase